MTLQINEENYYTISEVAKKLGLKESTFKVYHHSYRLPESRKLVIKVGNTILYPEKAVEIAKKEKEKGKGKKQRFEFLGKTFKNKKKAAEFLGIKPEVFLSYLRVKRILEEKKDEQKI